MPHATTDRFKAAVQHAEQHRDTGPLLKLFAASATCDSPAHEKPLAGKDGVELFWGEYLDAFESIASTFTHESAAGDTAVLEWISKGTLPTGKPIEYRGVSIVTFAGEQISRFVAYYDSSKFVADAGTPAGATTATGYANDNGGD